MTDKKNESKKELLKKYLADPAKRVLYKDENGPDKRFEFEDWVKDLPDERRVGTISFFEEEDGTVRVFRRSSRTQKFLCVGGPEAGRKLTDQEAGEYILYNCAAFNRGSREKDIPRAVLVHRGALVLALAKKAGPAR